MKEELLKGLTAEQLEKVKDCKSSEELLKIAKEEGIELSNEQLEAVSGGCATEDATGEKCPKCGGGRVVLRPLSSCNEYECLSCGHKYYKDPKFTF